MKATDSDQPKTKGFFTVSSSDIILLFVFGPYFHGLLGFLLAWTFSCSGNNEMHCQSLPAISGLVTFLVHLNWFVPVLIPCTVIGLIVWACIPISKSDER